MKRGQIREDLEVDVFILEIVDPNEFGTAESYIKQAEQTAKDFEVFQWEAIRLQ